MNLWGVRTIPPVAVGARAPGGDFIWPSQETCQVVTICTDEEMELQRRVITFPRSYSLTMWSWWWWWHQTLFLFLLNHFLNCYCSCPYFPPFALLRPSHPRSHSHFPHFVHVHGSFIHVLCLVPSPSFHHYPPPYSPLVTVSLFHVSMLVVLFCLFILFIRFFLQVRSYSICLSPTGWFHLA